MEKAVDNSVEGVENAASLTEENEGRYRRVHSIYQIIEAIPNWNHSLRWYVSTCICGWSSRLYTNPGDAKGAHTQHIMDEASKIVEATS